MDPVKQPRAARRSTLRAERAEATRRRIATAARRLFAQRGYGATTLAAVATEAGVAVQTIYAVYGSKTGILDALRLGAMAQPEARAAFALAMAEPDPARRLHLFARSIRRRWEAEVDVVAIHHDAATTDPAVRAGMEETLRIRRGGMATVAGSLEGRLRPGLEVGAAAGIVDALTMPEVYLELVQGQGWTPDAYETWLADALVRELLAGG